MNYCLNPYCKNPPNPDHVTMCLSCNSTIILDNRYRPIKFIGGGGQGRNFLAIDEKTPTKKRCVIKQFCPHPNIANDPGNLQKATELFNREATVLDELGDESPQIPRLLAHLEQDKRLYLVQEFIDGENLLNELAQNGNFSEAKINDFLNEFLPILKFVHQRGVIHRDIKPENIMRKKDGLLVLIDFGLSKQMSGTIMVMGTVGGTMGYSPTEQLVYGEAYFASDIYALGATCIHLLTGIPPHNLFNPQEKRWLWEDILSQRGKGVSKYLSQILDKMLMSAVKDRYQSVDEILQVLTVDTYDVGRNIKHKQQNIFQNIFQKIFNIYSSSVYISSNINLLKTIHTHFANDYISFYRDGKSIATTIDLIKHGSSHDTRGRGIYLWDWQKEVIINSTNRPDCLYFAFHPDREKVATIGLNKMDLIELKTGQLLQHIDMYNWIHRIDVYSPMIISPNGEFLAVTTSQTYPCSKETLYYGDGMISICNLESRKILYRLSGHYLYPNCLAFSPNSQILASSGGDGLIKLWNLKTGYLLRTLADPLWNLESLREDTRGFIYSVRHLSFNPQGDMVASAGWDKNIKLWNTNNGQLIRTLTGHKDAVNSVAFSPDGQILASGSNDMTIKLWEVNTGKEICTLKGHTGFINCVAFSPDDQVLASGSNDKTIKIWRWD